MANMLIKECKNYLLRECANCGCHLNEQDTITQPTATTPGSNLSENNFNMNAISYIYKIPPEELISNVLSHIMMQSGQPSPQFSNLTADECLQLDFVFCKTCTPMFGEVYRSHKIFHLWSTVGNLLSKAIQPYSPLKEHNIPKSSLTVEDATANSVIDIKSETEDNESDSIEETANWDNNYFVYIEPTNQYENLCEIGCLDNDPLSDDVKCEIDSADFENNQNNSDPFSEIVTNAISNDGDGNTIFDTHQTASAKQPSRQVFPHTFVDPQCNKIIDDTNNLRIDGPPFHCPRCTKMPPFQYPNGLRLHCKIDHHLLIPDSAFSREALKNSDMKYTTHPTIIKGPPYQCPTCVDSFDKLYKLKKHCKNVHLLLLPRQKIFTITRRFCRLCEKELRGSASWQDHYRSQHNCSFVCRLCKIGFETNEDLQTHFKTDCGRNASLSKVTATNKSPNVAAETEEKSIEDVNEADNFVQPKDTTTTDSIVANISHSEEQTYVNKETTSNVSMKPAKKFIFFDKKKSETPPFECNVYVCNKKFAEISLLEDHYLTVHEFILKVKDKKMSTYFCHECTESVYGKEEFKEHLIEAHKEKFASCKPPSEDPLVVLERSRLKCDECGLIFEHYNLLKQHSFESHSITLESYEQRFYHFSCRVCASLFETSFGLGIHLRQRCNKNTKDKMLGCKYCSTTFNSTQKLITHMKYVHDIKKSDLYLENDPHVIKCVMCLNVFNSPRDLQYHKNIIRDNAINSADGNQFSSVTCQFCRATFTSTVGLKSHQILMHRKECFQNSQPLLGSFNCDICSKSFRNRNRLGQHIRLTHMKLKKTCKICQKNMPYSSFVGHMRTHTGYRPYKCNFCDKKFISSTRRKTHETTIHNEACPFKCATCGKGFKIKVNLKLHQETHRTDKRFICERCGVLLKTKGTYQLHMRNHKKDDLAGPNQKCDKCDKTFSSGRKLGHHKLISHNKHGPIPCHICGKQFALKIRVIYHIKAVHPESLRKENQPTELWGTRRLRSRKNKSL